MAHLFEDGICCLHHLVCIEAELFTDVVDEDGL
jgi:hypothetical protein